MEQFQISSSPRHLRYVYFVKSDIDHEKLVSLIVRNHNMWGGRYNPIVPVKNGVISERYIQMLSHLDPDYVVFEEGIDVDSIKRLRIFSPAKYVPLNDSVPVGVNVNCLHSYSQRTLAAKKLVYVGSEKTPKAYTDFTKINLGVGSETTWGGVFEAHFEPNIIVLNGEEVNSWFELLFVHQPISMLQPSTKRAYVNLFRPKDFSYEKRLEIVVSKDTSSVSDLLYFWNRKLFKDQSVVFLTLDQLKFFLKDSYFQKAIVKWTWYDVCRFVSSSLTPDELKRLLNGTIDEIMKSKQVEFSSMEEFPFEVLDSSYIYESSHRKTMTTQLLNSSKGLYFSPKPDFDTGNGVYAIDTKIRNFEYSFHSEVLYPSTTETRYIFDQVDGRVNRGRNLTIYTNGDWTKDLISNITVPSFDKLIRQLIVLPVIDGERTENDNVGIIGPNDTSDKLLAFLKIFESQFSVIDDFLSDVFWVDVFKSLSLSKSPVGDSLKFCELKERAIKFLTRKGIKLEKKEQGPYNHENMDLGLRDTLEELCLYRVFFKGFTIKCNNCSSYHWYSLDEVGSSMKCKGCQELLDVPVEPAFSYQLNKLVKNNFYEANGNSDGNLTVIRTLISLYNRSHRSFNYSPQINLYTRENYRSPIGDLDIVCLSDGKLIIGEAKHNSSEFKADSNKCLKTLVLVAKSIRPDTIVLSCSIDTSGRIEKAKQGLIHLFEKWPYTPEIATIVLDKPSDFHVGGHRYFRY
jgi:hypothetical protein